jgi:mRNA interferase MazF
VAGILRGEIRWANLNPAIGHEQSGIQPVLILSSNIFNRKSGTVIAVAITSKKPRAGFPLTLPLEGIELPKPSWVKVSQVRNLSTERIGEKVAQVPEEIVIQVIEGLNEILGM